MKNFKEKAISTCAYMLARFLEGKDLNNGNLFTHYLEELLSLVESDVNDADWTLFTKCFSLEVIEGEYLAIINHCQQKDLVTLFNELYEEVYDYQQIFEKGDKNISQLQEKVLSALK